jgi:membrane associated rhomboid family serine protease
MRFQLTPVVKYLLIINLVVLLLQELILGEMINFSLGLWYIGSTNFAIYQFITYMFCHADWYHLFGNMLGLVIFGAMLESVWGPKRFLIFYLITGIGAALIHTGIRFWDIYQLKDAVEAYLADPSFENFFVFVEDNFRSRHNIQEFLDAFENNPTDSNYISQSMLYANSFVDATVNSFPMVGASGAVMGVVMAYALLFPNTEIFLLFPPIPIKAKYFALMYIAFDVFGIMQNAPGDNVAHFAHLGGMIFAFFIVQYWKTRRDRFY